MSAKEWSRAEKSGAVATVFVDADNTLWDTNAVYAEAQLASSRMWRA